MHALYFLHIRLCWHMNSFGRHEVAVSFCLRITVTTTRRSKSRTATHHLRESITTAPIELQAASAANYQLCTAIAPCAATATN